MKVSLYFVKESYGHYLSFANLVSCVAYVLAMFFQLTWTDIFHRFYHFVG